MTPEPLPDWLRQLLVDLYHPLGKRRTVETFAPLAKFLQQVAEAANSLRKERNHPHPAAQSGEPSTDELPRLPHH